MRRFLAALTAATVLVALVAAPIAAAPIKVAKPSLVTSACVSADRLNMQVTINWSDQVFADPNARLDVTYTFKGRMLPASSTTVGFIPLEGGHTDPGFATANLNKFIGPDGFVDWNSWSTIGVSTSGAFSDTAKALRQPTDGWRVCT